MLEESATPASLRALLDGHASVVRASRNDYSLAGSVGVGYLGRSASGAAAFLVPLTSAPAAAGRRGGGFALRLLANVVFEFDGREWEQPAAAIECTDPGVLDAFLVLVIDLARRLGEEVSWRDVLDCVDEWQALLTRRSSLTVERQLGLWGELWLVSISPEPDRLAIGWRGPDGDATDFLLGSRAMEVKASRRRHVHHISQSQTTAPTGSVPAYLLSIWLGIDPENGLSLGDLVEQTLSKVTDGPALLRRIAQVGYLPADRDQYDSKFVVLERPLWWHVADVPRVREVDPGISQVRYVATLDAGRALSDDESASLWLHFCRTVPPP
jgi:hypothetical protein